MLVLGLETSCDETGIALYDTERGLLAHEVYSQIAVHAEYGGVVPELASRDHVRKGLPLINEKPTWVRKRKAAAAVKRHLKKVQREQRKMTRLY